MLGRDVLGGFRLRLIQRSGFGLDIEDPAATLAVMDVFAAPYEAHDLRTDSHPARRTGPIDDASEGVTATTAGDRLEAMDERARQSRDDLGTAAGKLRETLVDATDALFDLGACDIRRVARLADALLGFDGRTLELGDLLGAGGDSFLDSCQIGLASVDLAENRAVLALIRDLHEILLGHFDASLVGAPFLAKAVSLGGQFVITQLGGTDFGALSRETLFDFLDLRRTGFAKDFDFLDFECELLQTDETRDGLLQGGSSGSWGPLRGRAEGRLER